MKKIKITTLILFLTLLTSMLSIQTANAIKIPTPEEYLTLPSVATNEYDSYIYNLSLVAIDQLPQKYAKYKKEIRRNIEVQSEIIVHEINASDYNLSEKEIKFIIENVERIVYNVNLDVYKANVPLGYLENLPFVAAHKAAYLIIDELKKSPALSEKEIKQKAEDAAREIYNEELCKLQKKWGTSDKFYKQNLDNALKISAEKYVDLPKLNEEKILASAKTEQDVLNMFQKTIPDKLIERTYSRELYDTPCDVLEQIGYRENSLYIKVQIMTWPQDLITVKKYYFLDEEGEFECEIVLTIDNKTKKLVHNSKYFAAVTVRTENKYEKYNDRLEPFNKEPI